MSQNIIHQDFHNVFREIFEKAYSLNRNAVALFVMSTFPSRPGIEKLLTFDKYVCEYIDQFKNIDQLEKNKKNILFQQETCWWSLEIFEHVTIQNVLLNLFYIISGKSVDDICNFWQQNMVKRKGDKRQIIIDESKKCGYFDVLQLEVIYSPDVRNNIAHGSYFLFDEYIYVLSSEKTKNENILEDFFCNKDFYNRISFSEFFGKRMNIIQAFYYGFIVTFLEFFEKYYKNYNFEFEYHKSRYEYRIALNNRKPTFELKKLTSCPAS